MIDLDQLSGALKDSVKNLEAVVGIVNSTMDGIDESKLSEKQLSEIKATLEETGDMIKKTPEMISQVETLLKQKR